MTACEYGSEKKPLVPVLFAIDDNPLCFLWGLEGFLCKLGKIAVAGLEGKKPVKAFIRNRIKEILADAFNGEFVITAAFCQTMPPPIPEPITNSDIAAWLLSLADPSGLIPSGDLPDKIAALWRIQKWQQYCQCIVNTTPIPPEIPPLPNPDEPQPTLPPNAPTNCGEYIARAYAGQARQLWQDLTNDRAAQAFGINYRAQYCPNATYTSTIPQPLGAPQTFFNATPFGQVKTVQYQILNGIENMSCSGEVMQTIYNIRTFECTASPNLPPLPTDYPYYATPNEVPFDFEQFCIDEPGNLFCNLSDKKCCCYPYYFWSN